VSPKRVADRRDGKVWVYLTAGEHTELRRVARASDLTMSAFVRVIVTAVLAAIRDGSAPEPDAGRLGRMALGFPVELRPAGMITDGFGKMYPEPHEDVDDVCQCPDHMAMRSLRD